MHNTCIIILTKSTVMKQLNGNNAQMNATWRHENIVPKPKTTRKPVWCDNNAIVIIAPRILGSLISLTYVMAGVSFSPIQNPISVKPTQINGNDWAKPKLIHVTVNGIVKMSNVLRRPIRSLSGPLSNAPIGCAIYENVANHDVCAPVTRTISSGFNCAARPSNDGMTIAENAVNSPKLKMIKFFAVAAKNCVFAEHKTQSHKNETDDSTHLPMKMRRKRENEKLFARKKKRIRLTCGKMRRKVLISWFAQLFDMVFGVGLSTLCIFCIRHNQSNQLTLCALFFSFCSNQHIYYTRSKFDRSSVVRKFNSLVGCFVWLLLLSDNSKLIFKFFYLPS